MHQIGTPGHMASPFWASSQAQRLANSLQMAAC
jgi:hypothetical protein